MDIIEALNDVKYQPDLWDELNRDIATKTVLINFPPQSETRLRLLGPFQLVKRLYMEYSGYLLSKQECYNIAQGNLEVYEAVKKRVENKVGVSKPKRPSVPPTVTSNGNIFPSLFPSTPNFSDGAVTENNLLSYLEKLYNNPYWQKCLMVNAWVKEANNSFGDLGSSQDDVKICCLTQSICSSMLQRGMDINFLRSLPISGIFAHDMLIKRKGVSLSTQYKMTFSKEPSYLDNNIVQKIISKGLWDFSKVTEELNNSSSRYVFKVSDKYRMPAELNRFIFSSYEENEAEHFAAVEREIGDLPDEAIEGRQNFNNTIQTLEM